MPIISYKTWKLVNESLGPIALGVKPPQSLGITGRLAPDEDEGSNPFSDDEVGEMGVTAAGDEMGGEGLDDLGSEGGDGLDNLGDDNLPGIGPNDQVHHHIHHHIHHKSSEDEFPGSIPTDMDDIDYSDEEQDDMDDIAGLGHEEPDGDEGGEDDDNDGDGDSDSDGDSDGEKPEGPEGEGEDGEYDDDGLDFDPAVFDADDEEEGDEEAPALPAPEKKPPFGKKPEANSDKKEKADKPEKKEKKETEESNECVKCGSAKCKCGKKKCGSGMKFCNEDDGFLAALLNNARGQVHRKQAIRFKEDSVIPPVNPNTGLVDNIMAGDPGFAPQNRVGGGTPSNQAYFGFSQVEDLPSLAEWRQWKNK